MNGNFIMIKLINTYICDREEKLITMSELAEESPDIDEGISTGNDNVGKVILYNDEWHTFDEVVFQIIKAIKCSMDKAEAMTWEVHTKGKAIVFDGDLKECLRVSTVLEEISLRTHVEM